jgi:hypothetical protein
MVERNGEDGVCISGVDAATLALLHEVPSILHYRSHPNVSKRFFPDVKPGDAQATEEFHEAMDPDLEYLFASAEEILIQDLAKIREGTIDIPDTHVRAWMSALNQARLILAELNEIDAADMGRGEFDPGEKKDLAVLKIHFFGFILHLFIDL